MRSFALGILYIIYSDDQPSRPLSHITSRNWLAQAVKLNRSSNEAAYVDIPTEFFVNMYITSDTTESTIRIRCPPYRLVMYSGNVETYNIVRTLACIVLR